MIADTYKILSSAVDKCLVLGDVIDKAQYNFAYKINKFKI